MKTTNASFLLLALSVAVAGTTMNPTMAVMAQSDEDNAQPKLVVLETLPGDQLLQVVEAAGGYTFFATYDCSTNETKVYGPPTLDYIGENQGNQKYGLCQGKQLSLLLARTRKRPKQTWISKQTNNGHFSSQHQSLFSIPLLSPL